jgi:anthranilate synthase component II
VTTLIVDNYDSFTWNLVQLVGSLGDDPVVLRNDAIDLAGVRRLSPARIILSPGPGHPDDDRRLGVCRAIVDELSGEIPILGVCLGHQAIVRAFGGRVIRSARPMHGKSSVIHHDGSGLFEGAPASFEAMRYHSLVADPETIRLPLRVTAWCTDGTVMGVRHRRHPTFGLQFHPESIGTAAGPRIVASFFRERALRPSWRSSEAATRDAP